MVFHTAVPRIIKKILGIRLLKERTSMDMNTERVKSDKIRMTRSMSIVSDDGIPTDGVFSKLVENPVCFIKLDRRWECVISKYIKILNVDIFTSRLNLYV